jgi:hypothetical protein
MLCLLVALFGAPGDAFQAPARTPVGTAPALTEPAATPGTPRIAISPDVGPPQSITALVGSGFTAGAQLTIAYVDPQNAMQALGSAVVAADGTIAPTRVQIPVGAAAGATGLLVVRQAASGTLADTPFGVTPLAPDLVATPNLALPGGTISLRGDGFDPDSAIHVQWLSADGPLTLQGTGPITTSDVGATGAITLTVPLTLTATRSAWVAIDATDAAGHVAGLPLMLLPPNAVPTALRLDPARAVLGARVQVAAGGFFPGEHVDVTLIGATGIGIPVPAFQLTPAMNGPGAAFAVTLTADDSGAARGEFTVPSSGDVVLNDAPGTVAGDGGTMLTVTLHGEQSDATHSSVLTLSAAHLDALPAITTPGHPYTLRGSGFAAGEPVRAVITDDSGASAVLGTFTAASCAGTSTPPSDGGRATSACGDGSFTALATAPRAAPASPTPAAGSGAGALPSYAVAATGTTSGLSANATLLLTSAPTLTLQRYVVAPGQSLVLRGDAFVPNAPVTIQAAFPARAAGSCATAGATPTGSATTAPCTITILVATDGNGSFSTQITVPLAAQVGPIPIQAQDARGQQASAVLTVNTQRPSLRLPSLSAQPGQVVTIYGVGFGSGETVDVALAMPQSAAGSAGAAQPGDTGMSCGALRALSLPGNTLTTTADALGSFVVSYPLPDPFAQGTYYVAASGETSGICVFYPLSVENQAPTPLPTATPCARAQCRVVPTPTPTSTPIPVCTSQAAGAAGSNCASDTVIYFADGSTAQISTFVQPGKGYPGAPCSASAGGKAPTRCVPAIVSFREALQLVNQSDQSLGVDIEYLIYGLSASQLRAVTPGAAPSDGWIMPLSGGKLQVPRKRHLVLPPRAAITRSVNADIGDGHLVSIIVRAGGAISASVVTQRDLLIEGCAPAAGARTCVQPCSAARPCAYTLDAAGSAGSGAEGPQTTWLFAQGYLGGAFDEYLSLLNPQTDPVIVQLRILTPAGTDPHVLHISVPPSGRQGVDLQSAIHTLCAQETRNRRKAVCSIRDGPIGLQISSTEPVVAERAMYWGAGSGPTRAGYDVGAGAPAALTRGGAPVTGVQYIPYASTLHGDQADLALLDPTIHPATVAISAYSASGFHLADKTLRIPARGCATLSLASMVFPGVYSLVVQSDTAVTGEVAQYGGGSPQDGAHAGFIEPLLSAQAAGSAALLVGADAARAVATGMLLRVFNTGSARIVARVSADGASGATVLGQYQLAPHATLQTMVPTRPRGMAPVTGVSIACSGPCAALALASAAQPSSGATPGALWSSILQSPTGT